MSGLIFVSHASSDKRLVDIICQFLEDAGIGTNDFFCSSRGSITPGEDDLASIYRHLDAAKIFLEVISTTYMTRPGCLIEVGYAIARNRHIEKFGGLTFIPLVIPPADYNDAKKLHELQSITLRDSDKCGEFTDTLFKTLAKLNVGTNTKRYRLAESTFATDWMTALDAESRTVTAAPLNLAESLSAWRSWRDPDSLPATADRIHGLTLLDQGGMSEQDLLFLYEGAAFDGKYFPPYAHAVRDNQNVVDILTAFMVRTHQRPCVKYRIAYGMQYWSPDALYKALTSIRQRVGPGTLPHWSGFLHSIQQRTVRDFVSLNGLSDLDPTSAHNLLIDFDKLQESWGPLSGS